MQLLTWSLLCIPLGLESKGTTDGMGQTTHTYPYIACRLVHIWTVIRVMGCTFQLLLNGLSRTDCVLTLQLWFNYKECPQMNDLLWHGIGGVACSDYATAVTSTMSQGI